MAALCLPGAEGFTCSIIYLVAIAAFFLSAILRKAVSDNFSMSFSVIGGTVLGIILELVFFYLPFVGGVKASVLGAIIGIAAGGFLGGTFLPDVESES